MDEPGCAPLGRLDRSADKSAASAASIGIQGGHVHALGIQAARDEGYRQAATVCVDLPLANPLVLRGPLTVAAAYHAEGRKGWVKGRLRLSVNAGPWRFAWLGGGAGPGEIRTPVSAESVVSAGGLVIRISLEGWSRGGSQVLMLDRIGVTDR